MISNPVRPRAAVDRVDAWGLEEASFDSEPVVNVPIADAVRYGAPPIRLRLIGGASPICAVFDGDDLVRAGPPPGR
ncbi:hypothetical protein GCM10017562_64610 [Streptomyces roseofulvus]|uniref:hypothetical protein n=1 Tax=Streptomyces roseofulvus TaxID=33902 RepID=UPI0031FC84FB